MRARNAAIWALLCVMAPAAAVAAARGAPLTWGTKSRSSHAPYADGQCTACHDRKGPHPGPPSSNDDQLCLNCHEEIVQHAHAFNGCIRCHNAHDSVNLKLLNAPIDDCPKCHRW